MAIEEGQVIPPIKAAVKEVRHGHNEALNLAEVLADKEEKALSYFKRVVWTKDFDSQKRLGIYFWSNSNLSEAETTTGL